MPTFEMFDGEGSWIGVDDFGREWLVGDQGRYWLVEGPRLDVEYRKEHATKEEAFAAVEVALKEQDRLDDMARDKEFYEVCAYEARFGK